MVVFTFELHLFFWNKKKSCLQILSKIQHYIKGLFNCVNLTIPISNKLIELLSIDATIESEEWVRLHSPPPLQTNPRAAIPYNKVKVNLSVCLASRWTFWHLSQKKELSNMDRYNRSNFAYNKCCGAAKFCWSWSRNFS